MESEHIMTSSQAIRGNGDILLSSTVAELDESSVWDIDDKDLRNVELAKEQKKHVKILLKDKITSNSNCMQDMNGPSNHLLFNTDDKKELRPDDIVNVITKKEKNRLAAKKSRDKDKQEKKDLQKENLQLKKENAKLKEALMKKNDNMDCSSKINLMNNEQGSCNRAETPLDIIDHCQEEGLFSERSVMVTGLSSYDKERIEEIENDLLSITVDGRSTSDMQTNEDPKDGACTDMNVSVREISHMKSNSESVIYGFPDPRNVFEMKNGKFTVSSDDFIFHNQRAANDNKIYHDSNCINNANQNNAPTKGFTSKADYLKFLNVQPKSGPHISDTIDNFNSRFDSQTNHETLKDSKEYKTIAVNPWAVQGGMDDIGIEDPEEFFSCSPPLKKKQRLE